MSAMPRVSPRPRARSQEPAQTKDLQTEDLVNIIMDTQIDSERAASIRDSSICRSVSDPFAMFDDDGDEEEKTSKAMSFEQNEDDPAAYFHQPEGVPFQTLPRYPVASTRNLNCWSEPSVEIFHVRGWNYLVDKKKIPSGPYLLTARGCDLFLSKCTPPKNIGQNSSILGGYLRKAPTFILSFRFPWGVLVQYFEIPERFCPFLKPGARERPPSMEKMSAAEKTLAKFFMADETEKNSRLKLIPYVAEGPWIVKNMVTGKPAIIGNKLPVSYTYEPPSAGMAEYLEADLDIGNSSKTARRIVSVCRRYMNCLTFDIGLVIQGNSREELPEQMLGSIRIHGVDPVKAPSL